MAELDGPTVLIRLIDGAERLITARTAMLEGLDELSAQIDTLSDTSHWPACVGDEAVMLATAMRNANNSSGAKGDAWRMIIGALLPLVRAALGKGIEERRSTAARSDPDAQYRGPNWGGAKR
jgi:hypothetical protein